MDDTVVVVDDDAPPRWARILSYSLVGLILVFGATSTEAWPLSAFKLFSGMRGDERISYQIEKVDSSGNESELAFGDLPVAYRNTQKLLPHLHSMSEGEREATCEAWALTPREAGEDVEFLRVYRITDNVWPDGPETVREPIVECGRR